MTLKLIRIHRLKQFQAERNVGPVELGRLIGRKANQTSDLLNGRASFGEKVARSIEECAALPPGWLDQADHSDRTQSDEGRPAPVDSSQEVAVAPLMARMAKDANSERPTQFRHLLLASAWIRESLGGLTSVANLRFVNAPDDSMEPTVKTGDVLLVDTGVRECTSEGIHVLRANARLYVRRVRQRLDGTYEISGDSVTVKTADVLTGQRLQVLGRVLWAWSGREI